MSGSKCCLLASILDWNDLSSGISWYAFEISAGTAQVHESDVEKCMFEHPIVATESRNNFSCVF